MHISDYLKANNLTATAFADKIGRHKSTVTRLIKREMRPDPETMQRILEATSGAVTPNDFFDIEESPSGCSRTKKALTKPIAQGAA